RIAGALYVAVLVMTPGGFQLQPPEKRNAVDLAEDRDVQLGEDRPDLVGRRIGPIGHNEAGRIDVVSVRVADVETGERGADSGLHRSAGEIEQRAVGLQSLFVDLELLVET